MATVNIMYFRPAIIKDSAAAIGAQIATPEVFTSSGTSQSTTATSDGKAVARVVASGGNIWIAIGTAPTAVTNTGILILDGVPEYFRLEAGQKIALIN